MQPVAPICSSKHKSFVQSLISCHNLEWWKKDPYSVGRKWTLLCWPKFSISCWTYDWNGNDLSPSTRPTRLRSRNTFSWSYAYERSSNGTSCPLTSTNGITSKTSSISHCTASSEIVDCSRTSSACHYLNSEAIQCSTLDTAFLKEVSASDITIKFICADSETIALERRENTFK